jgi:hypothetical protein
MKYFQFVLFTFLVTVLPLASCKSPSASQETVLKPSEIRTNPEGNGARLTIAFTPGKAHNHPLMALWIEDLSGNFIQNIYIPQSIARGVFRHGSTQTGKWTEGEIRRPAALPYWGHKWGVKAADGLYLPTKQNPLPDAVSGATPAADFVLYSNIMDKNLKKFRILMEINQAWDWNDFWNNNKYPGDMEYATSCQPALVYASLIDLDAGINSVVLQAIGHSNYAGKDGNLDPDLSTLTTALEIVGKITVSVN